MTSITPDSGPTAGGTEVTIRGALLEEGTGVLFGEQAALGVERVNEGLMRATTPPQDAGAVSVVLIDPDGVEVLTGASFTYQAPEAPAKPAPPAVASIEPSSGPVGGGTTVTIVGAGFTADLAVLFDGLAASSVNVANNGLLTAITPAHDVGAVDVTLDNGKQSVVLADGFTFVAPGELAVDSLEPPAGPTAGGTLVTIEGRGFVQGTAVLFGELSATDVTVTNDGLITATTPAHAAGIVDVAMTTPDLQTVTLVDAFQYAADYDGDGVPDIDSDGDGLTDWQELEGWDIWVDYFGIGLGTDTYGNFPGLYTVTSDPDNPDTDGDGLGDYTEYVILSDPAKIDTEKASLTDAEERGRWHTSPISVDTDGDCRGPGGELVPDAALFDGRELFTVEELAKAPGTRTLRLDATSPMLDDTDGDGRTDHEEVRIATRSPLIADLPQVEIGLEDAIDIRLNVEYAEEHGTSREYGEATTTSQTHTKSFSHSHMVGAEVGFKWGIEAEGTAGLFQWGSAKQTFEVGVTFKTEHTFDWSNEDSRTSQQEYHEFQTDSRSLTEAYSSGSMSGGILISNPGNIAYHLDNLGITVRLWDRSFDPHTGEYVGVFKTLATLTPALEGVTLAPGDSTPVLQVSAEDVNADLVKRFLAQPRSLYLETAYFDLETGDGVNFAFIEEVTQARTAGLVIDDGDGNIERYRFATNVRRNPDGTYAGVNLHEFLTEYLEIPITTVQEDFDGESIASRLGQIRGIPEGGPAQEAFWIVVGDNADFDDPSVGFEDIVLQAGDLVMFILTTDADGDGLNAYEEELYGTSDGTSDYDGDGLTDTLEARPDAQPDGEIAEPGWMVKVQDQPAYHVFSDPRTEDADQDGLDDLTERGGCEIDNMLALEHTDEADCTAQGGTWHPFIGAGCLCGDEATVDCSENDDQADCEAHGGTWTHFGTDPNNEDTDGDGISDADDPAPTVPAPRLYVKPDASGTDGLSWDTAHTDLQTAIADAQARNANVDPADDIGEIWIAAGSYTFTEPQPLISHVGMYGGFAGGETKRGQRDADPFTNGTALTGEGRNHRAFEAQNVVGATLDGFTISYWLLYELPGDGGGAMRLESCDKLVFRNMLFADNYRLYGGGGAVSIYNYPAYGEVSVENCVFTRNAADYGGGGALSISATTKVHNCRFLDNRAENGGAIAAGGELNVSWCRFEGNVATISDHVSNGGAVYTAQRSTFTNCLFARNMIVSPYMYDRQGGAAVRSCYDDYLSFTNCVFWRNSCEIWDDSCSQGVASAISIEETEKTFLTNCTIVGNYGSCQGSNPDVRAIWWTYNEYLPDFLKVENCIIACNGLDPSDPNDCMPNFGIESGASDWREHCLFSHTCIYPATDAIDQELVTIFMSMFQDEPGFSSDWATTGDLRLASGSPLIDNGNNYVDTDPALPGVQFLSEFDLDGNSRFMDGDGDGLADVDIGAYESQGGL